MSPDSTTQVFRQDGEHQSNGELGAWLAREMTQRWRSGERCCASEYLIRHPEIQNDPEAAVRLICAEVCLRQESGETLLPEEIYRRFPQWRAQMEMQLDSRRLPQSPSGSEAPASEEAPGDFILLAELGRGLHGRVYLASQPNLAERLVVVKITPRSGREHLALARLQHTHIMPLFAVYEDFKSNRRSLCMPYFGGAPLNRVLEKLHETPLDRRGGSQLLEALDRAASRSVEASNHSPDTSAFDAETNARALRPARQLVAKISCVQAICWMGACLADALHYAHERGLVHLDVKPSNVLIAADGQPMLLDFHVAQKPILPGDPLPEEMGGTKAYMSPEQQDAMDAMQRSLPIRVAVDGRSDLYSLGLVLYEALGGAIPLRQGKPPPSLRTCNPQVSWGLSDVVGKCLAKNSHERYASAAALATDLRRHLRDLPLQGVRNRSLVERWRKWRRRQPFALALAILGTSILATALTLGLFELRHAAQQRRDAEAALAEGEQQIEKRAFTQSVATLERGWNLAQGLPGGGDLANRFKARLHNARRAVAAEQLHVLVDRLRFLADASAISASEARTLDQRWRSVWAQRSWLKERKGIELEPDLEERLDADLLDLGVIGADLAVRLADNSSKEKARREALQVLAETESVYGASPILHRQRQDLARELGQTDLAEAAGQRAAELIPRTAWEHSSLGRFLLQSGDLERAASELDKAIELQPQNFWANFHQGVCAYRRKRFEEAVSAFRVCIALAPESAECRYNRGLALAALGRKEEALQDYRHALRLDPKLTAAFLNRGLLLFSLKNYPEAAADLKQALAQGGDPASIHYDLALVYLEQQNRPAAIASLQSALRSDADHKAARALLDQLQRK